MTSALTELEQVLAGIDLAGAIDIAVMAVLIYAALAWMRGHQMRRMALGVVMVLALYLVTRLFELELTATALEALLLVVLIAAIVLYGTEIRRLVERIFPFGRRRQRAPTTDRADDLARVLFDLASRRIGALVVIAGDDDLDGLIEGGEDLDGVWSEALIRSIFDTGSIGHDGAVILRSDRVWKFGCHLPLSADRQTLGTHRGTRHAAALGLSQRSDALAVAVSEERGTVTVCEQGALSEMDTTDRLADVLRRFMRDSEPGGNVLKLPRVQPLTAVAALLVATLCWLVIVHGSRPMDRAYEAKVTVSGLPTSLRVQAVHPQQVVVRATGAGRDFVMASGHTVRVTVALSGAQAGQHAVELGAAEVKLPRGLALKSVEPRRVSISIVPVATARP